MEYSQQDSNTIVSNDSSFSTCQQKVHDVSNMQRDIKTASSAYSISQNNKNTLTKKSPKVSFVLKGKLGHDMDNIIKSVNEIMIEPVDTEERFCSDIVHSCLSMHKSDHFYGYKKIEPKSHPTNKLETSDIHMADHSQTNDCSDTTGTGTLQSIADICASILGFEASDSKFDSSAENISNSEVREMTHCKEMNPQSAPFDCKEVPQSCDMIKSEKKDAILFEKATRFDFEQIPEQIVKSEQRGIIQFEKANTRLPPFNCEEATTSLEIKSESTSDNENSISDSESTDNKKDCDSRYSSSYTDDLNTLAVRKGGRNDPNNPFAMTSPSFSESAAKALMTTTQTSNATIVMVSIMSIGCRSKLIPKVVNSEAAQGGIISVVNPVPHLDTKETQTEKKPEEPFNQPSIGSKHRHGKGNENKEETKIDRLDINVRINDDQYGGHGENKRWLCNICPKSYTTKHNLVAHILDHSDIKPHLCLVCGKYFKQLSHLNTHMLTHDNLKPYVCTICDKGFTQISHLKRHETVHMGSKPYICDICDRGFTFPSELRLHKDKHVSGMEKCMECGSEFDSWNLLQEHLISSEHCSNLQCKYCQKFFKFPSLLRDHILTHVGTRPFICTECGMDFVKEHHLKSHQFIHTGLKPYSCPLCSRSFNQKANMQRHMLIHNTERAYRCDICCKTFTQSQTLKAHMVVHSDTKPYKCELCGKQFSRQHNLQGHMYIHSDSKPYTCSMCSSTFTLKGNLNRHKKVKHGLDESTELMEEDAVKFLSALSDRKPDLHVDLQRSKRKSRKSSPRKRFIRFPENEIQSESDNENEHIITYSDEERENERTRREKSDKKNCLKDTEKVKEREDLSVKDCDDRNVPTVPLDVRSVRKRKKKEYGKDFVECDRHSMKFKRYY